MVHIFKLLYGDLRNRQGRFAALQWLLREYPGELGVQLRARLYRHYFGKVGSRLRIGQNVLIHNPQFIFAGNGVSIGESNIVDAAGTVEIGDSVMFGPAGRIWSGEHSPDCPPGSGKVTIGSNVWIGAGVCVLPGALIGDGVVVSAGSVVGHSAVPCFKIVAGNPARVIGAREPSQPASDSLSEQERT